MDYVTLGRTKIKVCKNGFGALPIQRISFDSAKEILLHAYNSGINFFDTARFTQTVKKKSVMRCRTFVTKYTLPQKPPHKMPMIFGKT